MVKTKEEKAAYAREYRERNKENINKRVSKRRLERIEQGDESVRVGHNKRCQRYYDTNKDEINARLKENNWNYDKETRKVIRAKHYAKHHSKVMLSAIRCRATRDGLAFELTEEWYTERYQRGCSVTSIPFDPPQSGTPWVAHVDRIVPNLGYTISNCRLVCACFNVAKKNWTDNDVLIMARALVEQYSSTANSTASA